MFFFSKPPLNCAYGYTLHLDHCLRTDGISLVVLEETKTEYKGIKIFMDKTENFCISKDAFNDDIKSKKIVFIEKLPKFVLKELQSAYRKGLPSTDCVVE